MTMKRILILLLSLLAAVGGQAQGCIKGIVTDAKTGSPLPFVSVVILKDGKQVHGGTTDWDGVFVIKPLDTVGTYNIAIDNPGYIRYRREGVRVLPDGFTFVEIKLNQLDNIWLDTITIVQENYGSKDGAMLAPLSEYKIVSRELKRLLDRVIDGKCNTYDHKVKPRRIKRGAHCDLRITHSRVWTQRCRGPWTYRRRCSRSTAPLSVCRLPRHTIPMHLAMPRVM